MEYLKEFAKHANFTGKLIPVASVLEEVRVDLKKIHFKLEKASF